MSANISVLSSDSVSKLRGVILADPSSITSDKKELIENIGLNFVPTKYQLNETYLNLTKPTNREDRLGSDKSNCRLVLNSLPGLTPAQATDDRLWTTLSFFHCKEYIQSRWPFEGASKEEYVSNIDNHWFASGTRRRFRNNAISRLWWSAWVCSQVDNLKFSTAVETIFVNTEYVSGIMSRNTTTSAPNLTGAILQLSTSHFERGNVFNRAAFREFMKEVDLLNGKINLAAIPSEELVDILDPIFKATHSH